MNMEWISVKDRLPEYTTHAGDENFTHVIACSKGLVSEAMYCNGEWWAIGIKVTEHVTHWMPLPEPPKL